MTPSRLPLGPRPLLRKAASVKSLIIYTAHRAALAAEAYPPDTNPMHEVQLVALCNWSLVRAMEVMENASYVMTKQEADEYFDMLILHLKCLQLLAADAAAKDLPEWKLRPKLHFLWHLAWDTKTNRLNPRYWTATWEDESFLGVLKQTGKTCHGSTVGHRLLQRHFLRIAVRWAVPNPHVHIGNIPRF